MRLASTKTAAALCGGLLLAMSVPASAAVDAKLLDMLKANGSITNAQYSELQAELARDQKDQQIARQAQQETNEQIAATAKKTDALSTFDQKLAWAAKTQFKGDVRFRQKPSRMMAFPTTATPIASVFVPAWVPTPRSTRKSTPVSVSLPVTTTTRAPPTRAWTTTSTRNRSGWIRVTSTTTPMRSRTCTSLAARCRSNG